MTNMHTSVQPRYRDNLFVYSQILRNKLLKPGIEPLTIGTKNRASGGDFSHWNGLNVFSPENGEAGLSNFSIGKITEGTGFVDDSFYGNWPAYMWHPVRGAYHYARSAWGGEAQASYFLSNLKTYGLNNLHILGWDFESVGNTFTTAFMVQTHLALEYLVARFDGWVMLYTNRSLRNWLRTESLNHYGTDVFLKYKFWYAAPLFTPNPDSNPVLPTGVSKWDILQYIWTFDGRRIGIGDSTIDFNVWNGDVNQMLLDTGASTPPPPPPPPPDEEMDKIIIQNEKNKIEQANTAITSLMSEVVAQQVLIGESLAVIQAEIDSVTPLPDEFMVVIANSLNVRVGPGANYAIAGTGLSKNKKIKILERVTNQDNSIWVRHDGGGDGTSGWSCQKGGGGTIYLLPF